MYMPAVRTADCKVTTSSLPGLAVLGFRYSSCSEQLITKLLLLLYLVLVFLATDIQAVPSSWLLISSPPLHNLGFLGCRYSRFQSNFFFSFSPCRLWLLISQLFRAADYTVTSFSVPGLGVLGCRYTSCSEQLIAKLLLLLLLVLPSLAADILAVPNSWLQSNFFSSTWSWRPWLQIFHSCSEQLIAKLLLLLYLFLLSLAADILAVPNSWLQSNFFFSTWSWRPLLQIFQLFRTADWRTTWSWRPWQLVHRRPPGPSHCPGGREGGRGIRYGLEKA